MPKNVKKGYILIDIVEAYEKKSSEKVIIIL